ncbi:uncharacterized protein UTRI_02641 [Ustilago trichophora]|uniref:Uncharacterized protein n=1 Tax=Ustilago trichophora TaxID=86804 RepID=A0A5C3EN77_9BASI|nr:uncharacterized protein UTRI_02641 [Ustilago trichophora]
MARDAGKIQDTRSSGDQDESKGDFGLLTTPVNRWIEVERQPCRVGPRDMDCAATKGSSAGQEAGLSEYHWIGSISEGVDGEIASERSSRSRFGQDWSVCKYDDDVFCFWCARTSRVKVAPHKLKLGRGTGCGIGRIEFFWSCTRRRTIELETQLLCRKVTRLQCNRGAVQRSQWCRARQGQWGERFGELGVDVLDAQLLATLLFPRWTSRLSERCTIEPRMDELQAPLNRAAIKRSARCEVKIGGQGSVRSSGAMPGTAR